MAIRNPFINVYLGQNKFQRIDGLYQYDRGMKIKISGLSGLDVFTAHFAWPGTAEAMQVEPYYDSTEHVW